MRLHELTRETPKALAPISGRPIIWHIMRHFADHGLKRFIVCAGANGQRVAEYLSTRHEWEIEISDIGPEATKSQRIAAVLPRVTGDRFMLTYADDLSDVDLRSVERAALERDSTVTLTAVQPRSPFGVLDLAPRGMVKGFVEKRQMPQWINGGYMVVHKRIGDFLHLGEFEQEVFAGLIAENGLHAFRHVGFWRAMNTYKDYLELNELAQRGLCPAVTVASRSSRFDGLARRSVGQLEFDG
jgi:glucose-1-phosphate cytidylyltransferase